MQKADVVLTAVSKLSERKAPVTRIYRQMYNQDLYLGAYDHLRRNHGSLTPGINDETIDGMSVLKIERIIEEMRCERFEFKPARRVHRTTALGRKRSFDVFSFSDKLVQEVIRQLLQAYYEPRFSNLSHGYRPGRGCHTALGEIDRRFQGIKWFIKGDIQRCFENIHHDILMNSLRQNIQDNRLLLLIQKALQAGYLEQWQYHLTRSGVPQGGILSPILANIYLNEFDQFVEHTLLPKWNCGQKRRDNPEYQKYSRLIRKAETAGERTMIKEYRKRMRTLPSVDPQDPNFRRLVYVRYADDFLFGFAGPKREAETIEAEVRAFLVNHLGLTLNNAKSLITHGRTEQTPFLGHILEIMHGDTKLSVNQGSKKRLINGKIAFKIPLGKVQQLCSNYMVKGKPVPRKELIDNSVADIIQRYRRDYLGVVNFYQYAYDINRLNGYRQVMETSLTMTLATKLKISVPAVYRKYGSKKFIHGQAYKVLQETVQTGSGAKPIYWGGVSLRRQKQFTHPIDDQIRYIWNARSDLVQRLLAEKCEICGYEGKCEVHHVKRLADLKTRWRGRREKPRYVKVMIALRRKTLVVCEDCHSRIHEGIGTLNSNL
jgi:group II intron reverse transcriptase/maturase